MKIGRRGFFGLVGGAIAGALMPWRKETETFRNWQHADLIYSPPADRAVFWTRDKSATIPPHCGSEKFVIGQYADYYAEHNGMIEKGPGCSERLAARIDALPKDDPRWIETKVSA